MGLSTGMETALDGTPSALVFVAVQIDFPAGTMRLLDGSGQLVIDGETFLGEDPSFGVLSSIAPVEDGVAGDAPSLQLVINPPTLTAAGNLAAAANQGSPVQVILGVLNTADMTLLGEPYLLFVGEVDVPTFRPSQGTRSVTLDCVSAWDRFFEDDEGIRLTDNWLQSVWPGARGLQYVAEVNRQLPWGQDAPTPAVVTTPAQALATVTANLF